MLKEKRKLPIGVQSFPTLREDGFLYVDKTEYLYSLVHEGRQYFLSRPRRFGKSLFLSTLRSYWEGRKELFQGLAIEKLEQDNPHAWEEYPVFYFDFNRMNFQRETAIEELLDAHLREWEGIYGAPEQSLPLEERFQILLKKAFAETKHRCVVLVDEYDKPLLETMENEEQQEHNKAVFKGFFSALKSFDEYLQFVFITGVTKFSKVSIFSDLNHLRDISLTQQYAGICGITEEESEAVFAPEIEKTARENGLTREECLVKLKRTYDGYRFHFKGPRVYNPFSLLNSLADSSFDYYWFATGTPTFLIRKLRAIQFDVREFGSKQLTATASELSDYRTDNPDPVPLLYQSGYLTIQDYESRRQIYRLGFPNEEVEFGMMSSLLPEYTHGSGYSSGKDIFKLSDCLESGDLQGARDILTALFAGIPYPTGNVPFEHDFQSVIYIVFTLLGKFATCEMHSARGRADCVAETEKYVYLFEFKLDGTADEALRQIEEKGYAQPYLADDRTVFRIGVSFDSETRSLKEWKTV